MYKQRNTTLCQSWYVHTVLYDELRRMPALHWPWRSQIDTYDVATPAIVAPWIYTNSQTSFVHPRSHGFISKLPSDLYQDLISNKLPGFVFIDLMNRSWVRFVEWDRSIRFTGSDLRRSLSDRFWNQALTIVFSPLRLLHPSCAILFHIEPGGRLSIKMKDD